MGGWFYEGLGDAARDGQLRYQLPHRPRRGFARAGRQPAAQGAVFSHNARKLVAGPAAKSLLRARALSRSDMPEAEAILARFPGPVSLFVKRRRKLVSFAFCVGFTVFFSWLVFVDPDRSQYRSYDWIMHPISLVFWPTLAIRAAIMLLVPSIGSLTLDADGLAIKLFFRAPRISWRTW